MPRVGLPTLHVHDGNHFDQLNLSDLAPQWEAAYRHNAEKSAWVDVPATF